MIPSEIMRFAIEKTPEINIESTLRVLASPNQPTSEIPGKIVPLLKHVSHKTRKLAFLTGHESSDPVIKLVSTVFRMAEIEKRVIEAGFGILLSPEVSGTIMWFLRRWSLTYLLPQVRKSLLCST